MLSAPLAQTAVAHLPTLNENTESSQHRIQPGVKPWHLNNAKAMQNAPLWEEDVLVQSGELYSYRRCLEGVSPGLLSPLLWPWVPRGEPTGAPTGSWCLCSTSARRTWVQSDGGNWSPALTLKPVSDMLTPCWYVQQEAKQIPSVAGTFGLHLIWLKWSLKVNINKNQAYRRKSLHMKLGLTRLFCKAK